MGKLPINQVIVMNHIFFNIKSSLFFEKKVKRHNK